MTSDGELVRQALAGRTEAYAELVRRWAARVTALCHAKVRRTDVIDDLAQEALLRGYQALASLVVPEKFGPWLLGIAYRTCQDWLKSKQRHQIPFSAMGTAPKSRPCPPTVARWSCSTTTRTRPTRSSPNSWVSRRRPSMLG
jgi:DNA-directed RNA polymerase specialized sigma24 family protein